LLVCVIAAVPAEATVDHTYVSGTGTDTGGCSSSASACRHFAYALTQTSAAGEIILLNPAATRPSARKTRTLYGAFKFNFVSRKYRVTKVIGASTDVARVVSQSVMLSISTPRT
jgi:hypothetical protein